MKIFQVVLSNLIRSGKVVVETPNLDLTELRNATRDYATELLDEMEGILYEDAMTDGEKVAEIQKLLEREEYKGGSPN